MQTEVSDVTRGGISVAMHILFGQHSFSWTHEFVERDDNVRRKKIFLHWYVTVDYSVQVH